MSTDATAWQTFDPSQIEALRDFFNTHHDKLLCTANRQGEPNVSLMGTPRMLPDGTIDFEIDDRVSITLNNIRENNAVVFLTYSPATRARDYQGARISARVTAVHVSGEKFDAARKALFDRFGAAKADQLQATVSCSITDVRPIVDRGQRWDEAPVIA